MKKNLITKFKQRTRFFQGLVVGLSLTSMIAFAAALVKPHTFSANTTISASQVNANFDALYSAINNVPGFSVRLSTPLTISCSTFAPQIFYNIVPDIIDQNSDGNYTSGIYTITKAGGYILHSNINFTVAASAQLQIVITRLGSPIIQTLNIAAQSTPIYLQANDTIEVRAFCDNKGGVVSRDIRSSDFYLALKKI